MQPAAEPLRALVLGGGGVTGIAWETGVLYGLEGRGVALRDADLVVGTSAGAAVGAQITGPTALSELSRAQVDGDVEELPGRLGTLAMLRLVIGLWFARDPKPALARLGARAMAARTVPLARRRAVIEQRVPMRGWPERDLRIAAVEAESGALRVFDRTSAVSLVDAVAASCAVPLVWPAVPIGERHYMDGGMRSPANVDLAAGYARIVVLAPQTRAFRRGVSPAEQAARLGGDVRRIVIAPDAVANERMGRNPLDPAARRAAAEAGREQAARVADEVARVWS